jgi:hypothetical protein
MVDPALHRTSAEDAIVVQCPVEGMTALPFGEDAFAKRMATVLSPSHAVQSPQLSNAAQAATDRLADKFQLLVKLGGNCSLMPVKSWKFGAPVPERYTDG